MLAIYDNVIYPCYIEQNCVWRKNVFPCRFVNDATSTNLHDTQQYYILCYK